MREVSATVFLVDVIDGFFDVFPAVEPVDLSRSERHSSGPTKVNHYTFVASLGGGLDHRVHIEIVVSTTETRD